MRNTCLTIGLICILIFIIYNVCKIQLYKSTIKKADACLNTEREPYDVFKIKSKRERARKHLRDNILSDIFGEANRGHAIDLPILRHEVEQSDILIAAKGDIEKYALFKNYMYINYQYATKYNYNFIGMYSTDDDDKFVNKLLSRHKKYNYILYLGDNAYVFDFNQRIETWIDMMEDTHILYSKNCNDDINKSVYLINRGGSGEKEIDYGEFLLMSHDCDKNQLHTHPFIKITGDQTHHLKLFKAALKNTQTIDELQKKLKERALLRIRKDPMAASRKIGDMNMYYINLDRAPDRRLWMEQQQKDLHVSLTRLEAVDGKKLNSIKKGTYTFTNGSVLRYKTEPKSNESLYELGCMLSHINAIKTAYENGDEVALILEDDVNLYPIPMWKRTLNEVMMGVMSEVMNAGDENWGMINVCPLNYSKNINMYKRGVYWGTQGYIINREGMEMILEEVNKDGNDVFISNAPTGTKIAADDWLYTYLDKYNMTYNVRPLILPHNSPTMMSYITKEQTNLFQRTILHFINDYISDVTKTYQQKKKKKRRRKGNSEYEIFKWNSKNRYISYRMNEDIPNDPLILTNMNNSRICICMHGTIDMYPYYSKSIFINYEYAKNRGYDFVAIYDYYTPTSFVKYMFDTYSNYDYILYMDDSSYIFDFNQTMEYWIRKMGAKSMLSSMDCSGKVTSSPFILYKDMNMRNKIVVEYGSFLTVLNDCKKNERNTHSFIKKYPKKGIVNGLKSFKNTIKTSRELQQLQQQLKVQALKRVEDNPTIARDNLSGVSVYYINLARSPERREWIQSQARDLNISLTRLEAVDGKKLNSIKKGTYTFANGSVLRYETEPKSNESIYELGCMLSHINAIKTAYENGDEVALILEDDTLLYTIPMWQRTLEDVMNGVDKWGIISLCPLLYKKHDKGYKKGNYYGTQSYIINRKGMEMILDGVELDRDNVFISSAKSGTYITSDSWLYNYMNKFNMMYNVRPIILPYNSENMNSFIHGEHTGGHQKMTLSFIKEFIL